MMSVSVGILNETAYSSSHFNSVIWALNIMRLYHNLFFQGRQLLDVLTLLSVLDSLSHSC